MSEHKKSPSKGSHKKEPDDEGPNKDLSIKQILEGMTNEFNKTSPKKNPESPTRRSSRIEPAARKQDKVQNKKNSPDSSLGAKTKVSNNVEQSKNVKAASSEIVAEKNPPEEETGSKKDGNIPRIVLTFRTIDENTDHGKKTKISSCNSTLSVVTDDLTNCDQISGVSVKIENFEEQCDEAKKTNNESKKIQNKAISKDKAITTNGSVSKVQNGDANEDLLKQKFLKDMNLASTSEKIDEDSETVGDESSKDSSQEMVSSDKKSRQKRKRESSNEPELKRSSRRLSKEPSQRTSVLESAMARKEKNMCTEETTKRRYSRPGRPPKNAANHDKKNNLPQLNPIDSSKPASEKKFNVVTAKSALDKKDTIPKLVLEKKETILKLNTTNIVKSVPEKKDNIPPLNPIETSERSDVKKESSPAKSIPEKMEIDATSTKPVSLPEESPLPPPQPIQLQPQSQPQPHPQPEKVSSPGLAPTPEKQLVKTVDKKDSIPNLNPLNSPKINTDKKDVLPKLCPLNTIRTIIPISKSDLLKMNKYEGMPKLTPIVKSDELKQKFIQALNKEKSISSVSILKKSKQSSTSKHILVKSMKADVRSEQVVPASKIDNHVSGKKPMVEYVGSMQDLVSSDNPVVEKKARKSSAPSPNTAEGQASTPESTAILNSYTFEKPTRKKVELQCLCEVRSQLFVTITTAESPLYCTALDSIDSRVVGCSNKVDHDDVAMRRPSAKIPYIILCRMHKERLIRHNCCPTCGLFCSQGKFVHCSNGHQYHRACEITYEEKSLCPHCYSQGLSADVIISITKKPKPIYEPAHKKNVKEPSAKITLPGKGDNTKLAEMPVLKKSKEPIIDPELLRIPLPGPRDKTDRSTSLTYYLAVKSGNLQKLVNILAHDFGANYTFRDHSNRTPLHVAADRGHLACVHVLVQAKAQLDILDRNQLSPLMLAATNGHAEVVKYLMRIGVDITLKGEDGMTALHMAAKAGNLEVCKIILSECKTPRTLVDSTDDGGWTSLIWACEFSHGDVARFLIESKCDPLIRDSEQNIALHWSAYSGSSDITELLLDLGCDVNAVNVHGDTPLHIASRQNQYTVCVLLLSRGAKITETNNLGETAIDCCMCPGDTLDALQLNLIVNQRAEQMMEKTTRILTNDITRGKESNPVQCVNGVDGEEKPTDFVYVTENCYTSNINIDRTITSLRSCRCDDNCNLERCFCATISLRCWYDDEKKLIPEFNYADPPMLFECNPACDCNKITCNNRVVQHGISQRFQLFRTEAKGWGLRTLRFITKGSYVCEYIGEIISDSEADLREDDSYLFDLDNKDGETYCIDARIYGNISRFINHSCSPNLLPVRVFIDHQDLRFPRIAFFANRDIEADEELGFDYGDKFWIVKCKAFTCTCGAEKCRYSDKTIQITLENYRKRMHRDDLNQQTSSASKT